LVNIDKPPQNIDPALYNYLYQLAEVLSLRMHEVNQTVTVAVEAAKTGGSEKLTDGKSSEYQALKSLIIKTADVVKIKETVEGALAELDALETRLTKEYVASSQFGEYLEQINATISLDSEALSQYYEFVAQLKANVEAVSASFDEFRVDTEGYIRTGIVDYDEYGSPVFGMAVGRNLVVTENGDETVIEKKNFRALYTDNRLSFWQDEVEVAYMSNRQLYITNVVALDSLQVGKWLVETKNGFAIKWIGG